MRSEQIVTDYLNGLTVKEIVTRNGISTRTLYRALLKAGMEPRRQRKVEPKARGNVTECLKCAAPLTKEQIRYGNIYCSRKCSGKERLPDPTCAYCRKTFKGKNKYCSHECYKEAVRSYAGHREPCLMCGNPVRNNKNKCCSKACTQKMRDLYKKKNRCVTCGKECSSKKKYCSKECRGLSVKNEMAECLVCKTQVKKSHNKFCSRKCASVGVMRGLVHRVSHNKRRPARSERSPKPTRKNPELMRKAQEIATVVRQHGTAEACRILGMTKGMILGRLWRAGISIRDEKLRIVKPKSLDADTFKV